MIKTVLLSIASIHLSAVMVVVWLVLFDSISLSLAQTNAAFLMLMFGVLAIIAYFIVRDIEGISK